MENIVFLLLGGVSEDSLVFALTFMRVALGILTIGHGIPKMRGGVATWRQLGTFMHPLGIRFWPVFWGFLGAAIEFFGGVMLTIGFATRMASFFLICMMIVATAWHIDRKDSYNVYSFPISLIVVYFVYLLIGSGPYSLDALLCNC